MSETALSAPPNPVVEAAISKMGEIATLPEITVKIIQIVEDQKSTARDLHEVIRNDPALSAKILKVVNSAFYGLPGQIASVDRAIVLLGLSAIKNIAIAMSMTRMFRGVRRSDGVDGMELWRHNMAVATACRLLTKLQGRPAQEESFLAGLLHDLGVMVERQVFPPKLAEIVARVSQDGTPFCQVEREVLGADHQAFGAALAAKWRFPRALRLAIGHHHEPGGLAPESRELPALVHAADVLACRTGIGFCMTACLEAIDDESLEAIKLSREDVEGIMGELPQEVAMTQALFDT